MHQPDLSPGHSPLPLHAGDEQDDPKTTERSGDCRRNLARVSGFFVINQLYVVCVFVFRNPEVLNLLQSGHVIGKPAPLFAKIEPETLEQLKKRFGGKQQTNGIKLDRAYLEAAVAKQVRNSKLTSFISKLPSFISKLTYFLSKLTSLLPPACRNLFTCCEKTYSTLSIKTFFISKLSFFNRNLLLSACRNLFTCCQKICPDFLSKLCS